jgi:hypothetical protein
MDEDSTHGNYIINNNYCDLNDDQFYLLKENIKPGNKNNISNNFKNPNYQTDNHSILENNKLDDDEINRIQDEEEEKEMIQLKEEIINLLNKYKNIKLKYAQQRNIKETEICKTIQNIDDIEKLDNLLEYINLSIDLEKEY